MNDSVRVTANPTTGNVITPSENNPEYGVARVEQERPVFDEETGFLRIKKISALVPGTIADLNRLGWKDGQVLTGRIIFREQMLPFNKKDPGANLKMAGETGIVCRVGNDPIYRNTFYSPNPNAQDVPVPHTNGEEIKTAYAVSQAAVAGTVKKVKEFEL